MTEPADESYRELIEIHDRTFQNFSVQNNIYLVPVDEGEEDRLILQHDVFLEVLGKLFLPPIRYPKRILDCGYGRGSWAVAMAQEYEDSKVTAIDVYPAELPDDEPDNLECEVWNLNDPLIPTYRASYYDLVHSRCVGPGIRKSRWSDYIKELKRLLKHGGWVQCAEFYYNVQSDNGRLTERHELYRWGQAYRSAMDRDRDPRVGRSLGDKLIQAGFENVHTRTHRIPIGDWPTDARQKVIGIRNRENMEELLETHAILPFTQRLGWSAEQVGWNVQGAKQEMQDNRLKLYLPLYVAWGRRP